jgi:hypothetical protein
VKTAPRNGVKYEFALLSFRSVGILRGERVAGILGQKTNIPMFICAFNGNLVNLSELNTPAP